LGFGKIEKIIIRFACEEQEISNPLHWRSHAPLLSSIYAMLGAGFLDVNVLKK